MTIETIDPAEACETTVSRFLEVVPAILWTVDADGRLSILSRAGADLFGVPLRPERPSIHLDLIHPDDRGRFAELTRSARLAGERLNVECRMRVADGTYRWMQVRASHDPASGLWYGATEDIHDRRTAETALREREAYMKSLLDNLVDGVLAVSPDGRRGFHNKAYARTFLDGEDDACLDRLIRIFGEIELSDADGRVLTYDERPIVRVMRGETVRNLEVVARRRSTGESLNLLYNGQPVLGPDGALELALLIVRDVTEAKKAQAEVSTLQQELIEVSRVSAMGMMAGSLAHELNQPLAAVANYAAAIRALLADPATPIETARDLLQRVADEAVRAGQVIHRMRRFIAKGEIERRPASLGAIVREALAVARGDPLARAAPVKVRLRFDPEADGVTGDRVQLQQVVFNLVRNAIEAMAESATREVSISARPAGDAVELSIADRGPGLPAAVAARLFEPFVTTKEDGMGIGLPICRSIVRAHGGDIRAEPRTGGGTVFVVTLPRAG